MYGRVFVPRLLTERRTQLGWSLKELAAEAGMSYRNIRRLEKGERPTPYDGTLAVLARTMGCAVDDLTVPAAETTAAA